MTASNSQLSTSQIIARDLVAAGTVTFLAIPAGVAYAMIAGLPPAMGLYASAVPTIVGSLARSSRHVITGPSNALSLLVGGGVAVGAGADPVTTALLLALMVGVMQVAAGALRLGVLVDFISMPVVVGYITGAAVLIGVGQLPNLTATEGVRGNLIERLDGWLGGLSHVSTISLSIGLGSAVGIFALRWWSRRIPGAIVLLTLTTAAVWLLDLGARGVMRVGDLAPVPSGLPPLTVPDLDGWVKLVPLAVAATVLSLVEASSVARALAMKSGQRLDISREFIGQGLANVAAAFTGGYPTSGSLSRSELNQQAGAVTRYSGAFGGLLMVGVLLALGPVVDYTPIAALAGLLLVIAYDLINVRRIRAIVLSRRSDGLAFLATLVGTWVLPLDKAIYFGAGISVVLFLRRARLLQIQQIAVGGGGRPRELECGGDSSDLCDAIRVIQINGQVFFAAAGELEQALDTVIRQRQVQVVILRMRRAEGLDVTALDVLVAAADTLAAEGRRLMIVGVDAETRALFERTGFVERIGTENLFDEGHRWFASLDVALSHAADVVGEHACKEPCPVVRYIDALRHA